MIESEDRLREIRRDTTMQERLDAWRDLTRQRTSKAARLALLVKKWTAIQLDQREP